MNATLSEHAIPGEPGKDLPTARFDQITISHGRNFTRMSAESELPNLDIWLQRHASLRLLEGAVWSAALKEASLTVIPPNTVISGAVTKRESAS